MQKLVIIPDNYSVYKEEGESDNLYAVLNSEADKIQRLRAMRNRDGISIPEDETVNTYKIGRVHNNDEKYKNYDIYDIVDSEPKKMKVVDLEPTLMKTKNF